MSAPRIFNALRAIYELGPARSFWYAVYQAGLRSGHYRRCTPVTAWQDWPAEIRSPFRPPDRPVLLAVIGDRLADLAAEADEIISGKVRLFGGPPVPLQLAPPRADRHWTHYEGRPASWGVEDIKFIWEPARFGWAYTLGRAYHATGDERYPQRFWELFEIFCEANPPNQGPNWSSGQEAALRLMALLFARCAFASSPHTTTARLSRLGGAVAAHAARIKPTLSYARAQNNNHRISEALGLLAAGWALPQHPDASGWRAAGWREINHALQDQIELDGTYTQHSVNYHRLMLHAALQAALFGLEFPQETREKLSAAALWLCAQIDPLSGHAPNLGSNDGANILPLAQTGFSDHRPAAQAAARAFLGGPLFSPGPWDEAGLWLGQNVDPQPLRPQMPVSPGVHRLPGGSGNTESWATIRAVHFRGRPSHADQLHVDLWWQGKNVAMDAGTFRYTAATPWDNSLARTLVHNTVEINGLDQMVRAGRFLWLYWAQAELQRAAGGALCAQHSGYRALGVLHRRTLRQVNAVRWEVVDILEYCSRTRPLYPYRISWLLPDWTWKMDGTALRLERPGGGSLRLEISSESEGLSPDRPFEEISLVRAGEILVGECSAAPIRGWFSPTYNQKLPALSFSVVARAPLPLRFLSTWIFAPQSDR